MVIEVSRREFWSPRRKTLWLTKKSWGRGIERFILNENPCQTEKDLAEQFSIGQPAISTRSEKLRRIQKTGGWVLHRFRRYYIMILVRKVGDSRWVWGLQLESKTSAENYRNGVPLTARVSKYAITDFERKLCNVFLWILCKRQITLIYNLITSFKQK